MKKLFFLVLSIFVAGCGTLDKSVYDSSRKSRNTVGAGVACAALASAGGDLGRILGMAVACGAIANLLTSDDCTQNIVYSPVRGGTRGKFYHVDVGVAGHCITGGNNVEIRRPVVTGENVVIDNVFSYGEFFRKYPDHPAAGKFGYRGRKDPWGPGWWRNAL